MSKQEVGLWFQANGAALDGLIAANLAVARSSGEAARAIDGAESSSTVDRLCAAAISDLQQLRSLADRARSGPRVPDPTVDGFWQAALRDWATGAQTAEQGVRDVNVDGINRGSAVMNRAASEIEQAAAAVGRLV